MDWPSKNADLSSLPVVDMSCVDLSGRSFRKGSLKRARLGDRFDGCNESQGANLGPSLRHVFPVGDGSYDTASRASIDGKRYLWRGAISERVARRSSSHRSRLVLAQAHDGTCS